MVGDRLRNKMFDVTREWLFGRMAPRSFLKNLEEYLEGAFPDRAGALMGEITGQIPAIVEANQDVFPDEAGRDLLGLCATVLAAYRVLAPLIGDDEKTLEIFRGLAARFGQRSTILGTRLLMAKPGSKMESVVSTFKGAMPVLSKAWEVTFTRDGDRSFEMRFTKCGFHDFFVRNGVERLTTVFCAWDAVWMEEITPERTGIQADRPTTLGYGGDACPFQFTSVRR